MRLRLSSLGLLALAAASSACEDKKATAIIVSFSTEARPTGEVDALQVVVKRGGATPFDTTYDLPQDAPLPGTLTLDNGDGDPSEPVTVEVVATKAGKARILRRARLAFSDQKQKLLRMPLRYSCADFPDTCGPDQTCAGYQCVPIDGEVAAVREASASVGAPGLQTLSAGGGCFDAAACTRDPVAVTVASDCTFDPSLTGSFNLFMRWKIAPDNPVVVERGSALEGWTDVGGRPTLAPGLCRALVAAPSASNGATELFASAACAAKDPNAEPCTRLSTGAAGSGGGAGAGGAGGAGTGGAGAGGAGAGGAGAGGAGKGGAGAGGAGAGGAGKGGAGAGGAGAGGAGQGGAGAGGAGGAGAGGAGGAGAGGAGGAGAGGAGGAGAGGAGQGGVGGSGGAGAGGAGAGGAGQGGAGGAAACQDGTYECNGGKAALCQGGVFGAPVACSFGCDVTHGCNQCVTPADCGAAGECQAFKCNSNMCVPGDEVDGTSCGTPGADVCVLGKCVPKCVGTFSDCQGRQPVMCNPSTGVPEKQGATCPFACVAGQCGNITSLALGTKHSCFSTSQHEVFCWGANDQGQLGQTMVDGLAHHQPIRVTTMGKQLTASGHHTCALNAPGTDVVCWGDDGKKQLSQGASGGVALPTPTLVSWSAGPPASIDSLSTGRDFSLVTSGSIMLGAGDNSLLQFGDMLSPSNDLFTMVSMMGPTDVRAGTTHACGRGMNQELFCWGANTRGEALASASAASMMQSVPGPVSVYGVGGQNTCFERVGDLLCAGDNNFGQLGIVADAVPHETPVTIAPPGSGIWRDVAVGQGFVCAVFNVDVYCWGKNDLGQCGVDSGGVPVGLTKITLPEPADKLAVGDDHACVTGASTITCWGAVTAGKLGRFGTESTPGPVDFLP